MKLAAGVLMVVVTLVALATIVDVLAWLGGERRCRWR